MGRCEQATKPRRHTSGCFRTNLSRAQRIARLAALVNEGNTGRPGVLGRYLFPDRLVVARDLLTQLDIRAARQTLLKALLDKPDVEKCAQLLEDYFDKLLAWNQNTGWEKIIDTG